MVRSLGATSGGVSGWHGVALCALKESARRGVRLRTIHAPHKIQYSAANCLSASWRFIDSPAVPGDETALGDKRLIKRSICHLHNAPVFSAAIHGNHGIRGFWGGCISAARPGHESAA